MKHGQKQSIGDYGGLFSGPNRAEELEAPLPPVSDEQIVEDPNSSDAGRESSLLADPGPSQPDRKPSVLEDNFMLDSLNDQKTVEPRFRKSQESVAAAVGEKEMEKDTMMRRIENEREKEEAPEMLRLASGAGCNFMSALQTAIAHFETSGAVPAKESSVMLIGGKKRSPAHNIKESPGSSYNGSSATAANSMGEVRRTPETAAEGEALKKEYNALMAKYCELKSSNKKLMNDYAVLRSRLEEAKSAKSAYEAEVKQLRQQVYDAELRLTHTTELYTREKIEKESNALAFKRILETEANKHAGTSSVVSPTFGYSMAHNLLGEEPPQNVTLEHIQRLEDDLALKDQEIQLIKQRIQKDSKKPGSQSPSYSPASNSSGSNGTSRAAKAAGNKGSPPAPKVPSRPSAAGARSAAMRSPTGVAGRATLAQKPHSILYCLSAKGNIQFPGKAVGASPKTSGQPFHKFRSPSYTEQNATVAGVSVSSVAVKGKPPRKSPKKGTGRVPPKM